MSHIILNSQTFDHSHVFNVVLEELGEKEKSDHLITSLHTSKGGEL